MCPHMENVRQYSPASMPKSRSWIARSYDFRIKMDGFKIQLLSYSI